MRKNISIRAVTCSCLLLLSDTTLYYPNYGQEILEWTNVLGVSSDATTTTQNDPQSGYTHTTYGNPPQVHGYSAAGVGHTVPVHETVDLAWFCITGKTGWCVGGSTNTTTTTTTSTTSTSASGTTTTTSTSSKPTTTSTSTTTAVGPTQTHWGQVSCDYLATVATIAEKSRFSVVELVGLGLRFAQPHTPASTPMLGTANACNSISPTICEILRDMARDIAAAATN